MARFATFSRILSAIGAAALVTACGAASRTCPIAPAPPVRASASPACSASASVATAPAPPPAPPPPPRIRGIAPGSTSLVTSARPTLRWSLPESADGALVELCKDRDCKGTLASFHAVGQSARPEKALPAGVVFWRVTAMRGDAKLPLVSKTWSFHVGKRSAPIDASWGSTFDVDGDGFADVLTGTCAPEKAGAGAVFLRRGGPKGLSAPTALGRAGERGDRGEGTFAGDSSPAGDLDGDGFADLVSGDAQAKQAFVHWGSGEEGRALASATAVPAPPGFVLLGAPFGAGDVNGDGFADLGAIVSADRDEWLLLLRGSSDGIALDGAPIALDGASEAAPAGDLNGDGYADVIVGLPHVDPPGAIRVYYGGPRGLGAPQTIVGPEGSWHFGQTVASAGDLDGDGYADVAVGVEHDCSCSGDAYSVYVFRGGVAGLATKPIELRGKNGGGLGAALAGAGDVDGDGFADLLAGAPGEDRALLYRGGAQGPSPWPIALGPAARFGDGFGAVVTSAGDVDGDGLDDVVVSSWQANVVALFRGGALAKGAVLASPVACEGSGRTLVGARR